VKKRPVKKKGENRDPSREKVPKALMYNSPGKELGVLSGKEKAI